MKNFLSSLKIPIICHKQETETELSVVELAAIVQMGISERENKVVLKYMKHFLTLMKKIQLVTVKTKLEKVK